MLKDIDIRIALIKKLSDINRNHNYRIIEEMSVCDGQARVDVAVANGRLCGYEIKSDADTLERLPTQKVFYDKTFDTITIAVGQKYIDVIAEYIPEHWGIYEARISKHNKISLALVRRPRKNKDVDIMSLLDLMWKDEIVQLLQENNIKCSSRKSKQQLCDDVIQSISFEKIRNFTRETLKTRQHWRQ